MCVASPMKASLLSKEAAAASVAASAWQASSAHAVL